MHGWRYKHFTRQLPPLLLDRYFVRLQQYFLLGVLTKHLVVGGDEVYEAVVNNQNAPLDLLVLVQFAVVGVEQVVGGLLQLVAVYGDGVRVGCRGCEDGVAVGEVSPLVLLVDLDGEFAALEVHVLDVGQAQLVEVLGIFLLGVELF